MLPWRDNATLTAIKPARPVGFTRRYRGHGVCVGPRSRQRCRAEAAVGILFRGFVQHRRRSMLDERPIVGLGNLHPRTAEAENVGPVIPGYVPNQARILVLA